MRWLYRLARAIYGVKDSKITAVDLVVPLGYGLEKDKSLPDGAEKTLSVAADIASKYGVNIAWASSNYFWLGCKEEEDQARIQYLKDIGYEGRFIIADGISNSVTEAENIKAAVLAKKIPHKKITVVCDWPHARSALLVWRKVFPASKIMIRNIEANWNSSFVRFQKSNSWWLVVCLLRHAALIVLGLNRVAKIQHPLKEEKRR